MASTPSEQLVKQLLAAGADPAGPTLEGSTPLHLAARARESNIVGVLLEALTTSDKSSAVPGFHRQLHAKDCPGRTPLRHECHSGRLETVSLQLDAGADPTLQDCQGITALEECTEFEEEQELWLGWREPGRLDADQVWNTTIPRTWDEYAAGGGRRRVATQRGEADPSGNGGGHAVPI